VKFDPAAQAAYNAAVSDVQGLVDLVRLAMDMGKNEAEAAVYAYDQLMRTTTWGRQTANMVLAIALTQAALAPRTQHVWPVV
jgi:hypothetical protein